MYKIFNHKNINNLTKKTPFYLYDRELLLDTLLEAKTAAKTYLKHQFCIHYALKANDNKEILKLIHEHKFGIDCVSGGEVKKALLANFEKNKIVFAGVGKTDPEIRFALQNNIYAFNTESIEEIAVINKIAKKLDLVAKIMIRINPDVDAKTHKHISTGKYDNKFGITFDDASTFLKNLSDFKNIKFIGLHYHIGSQITDMKVFKELAFKINSHYKHLQILNINITDLDIGGGLGVNYTNPIAEPIANFNNYFKIIAENLDIPLHIKLHFELGRAIVAQCGVLISTVIFTKNTAGTNFAIIDAGMNDLMRPALYNANHKIVKINARKNDVMNKFHIVGPVCESTDIFAKNVKIANLRRSDKIILYSAGAYGKVLANQYNSRKLIKEYLI